MQHNGLGKTLIHGSAQSLTTALGEAFLASVSPLIKHRDKTKRYLRVLSPPRFSGSVDFSEI